MSTIPTILYIEDDSESKQVIGSYLEDKGYNVFYAATGEEGLQIYQQNQPQLILLDWDLTGVDGFQILNKIKEDDSNTPVLVISDAVEVKDVIQAMRYGADNYVIKTLDDLNLLGEAINKAFKEKYLREEKRLYQQMLERTLADNERYRHQLETILDSLPDGLINVNEKFEVMEFNRAMEQMCPLGKHVKCGKTIHEFKSSGKGDHCIQFLEKALENNKPYYNKRVECPFCESSKKVLLVTASPMQDERGVLHGATLIIKNISHQEKLEGQIQERQQFRNILGKSQPMQKIYTLIRHLAEVDTTVLVTGESGTGKENVVEALHFSGSRSSQPLCKVNCSALSEDLLDSELFGHVRGAFTGAHKDKLGRFEAAHNGTLFLDEIGEISHRIQLKLLRVLETKEFERVGSSKTIKVDVRIITATNLNLAKKVEEGAFRQDLYYRLSVFNIHIPPLRERTEDIPLLVDHFCHLFSKQFGKKIIGVTEEVLNQFFHYSWPGNVRELRHAMEHGCLLSPGGKVTLDHLPLQLTSYTDNSQIPPKNGKLEELDQEKIQKALSKSKGNKVKAAEILGIHRKTLYRKMHKLGIDKQK